MIQAGDMQPTAITLSGQVCDSHSPIASLTLNGQSIQVSGADLCVPFNVTQLSAWGLTLVNGEARNAAGRVTQVARSYLRGPDYLPPDLVALKRARVPHALLTQLSQSLLDDGNANTLDDIASIAAQLASTLNWNTNFPTVLTVSPDINQDGLVDTQVYDCPFQQRTNHLTGYRATHGTVTHGPVTVRIALNADHSGLTITVHATNLSMPVTVVGYVNLACAGGELSSTATGTARATSVTFTWDIKASASSQGASLAGSNYDVQTEGLVVDVDWSGLSIIDNLVGTIIAGSISAINSYLGQFLVGLLSPRITGLLSSVVPDEPTLPFPHVTLATQADTFLFPTGAMRSAASAQAYPTAVRAGPAPSFGALRRGGTLPDFAGAAFELGVAVKDDAVNQVLWAAWQSGTFDLTSLTPVGCNDQLSGAVLNSFAELPPVLMGSDATPTVSIGVGDLRLSGTIGGHTVTLYASGITTGTLGVSDAKLAFTPTGIQTAFEIVAIDDSSALDATRAALPAYVECVARAVARSAIESIPVPTVAVGSNVWVPGNAVVGREGHYTTIRGTVP